MKTQQLVFIIFTLLLLLLSGFQFSFPTSNRKGFNQQPKGLQKKITKDQIIVKYLTALGGESRIKKINSRTIKYKIYMLKRSGLEMESVAKRSGFLKIGRPGAPQYTLFEKGKAWQVMGDQKKPLTGPVVNQFSKMADIDGPFIDFSRKGITITYKGMVPQELSQLEHVEVLYQDGTKRDYYFDDDTGLIYMVKQPSFFMVNNKIIQGPTNIYYYYDYREVEGVKFPFSWIQTDEKLGHMHLFKVESIQLQ